MVVQDPAVVLKSDFPEGSELNFDYLKEYTRRGRTIDFLVWPALLLHDDGPVLAKGVAQPKAAVRAKTAHPSGSKRNEKNAKI